jgi:cell division protein FtsL
MLKISSWWMALSNTVRTGAICLLAGIIIGAGGVGYAVHRQSTALRSELTEYKSVVAARNRQLELLNLELVVARKLADDRRELDEQRKQLDAEINDIITAGSRIVSEARTEYDKAVERLKLHSRIYDALRRYYDPNYKPDKTPGG